MTKDLKLVKDWSIAKASEYYNIDGWGAGYFGANDKGHLCIHPYGKTGPVIDIMDVIDEIHDKNLNLPCIVRFQDILRSRVEFLNQSFSKALQEANYSGKYFGVYPIKVNQMREVVEEIVDAGNKYNYGLEAGSKGELITVLACNNNPNSLTICNGYKDEEFMRLAMLGRKVGRKVIVVIEKLSELPMLLEIAEAMQVEPMIGIRAKLSTKGAGKWVSSSGDFAKFGLTAPEMIEALQFLKHKQMEHCLKLFHFHVGSQLTEIRTVKEAVREGARFYAKLVKMGFPVEYFDVGGGLGVDYEGSNTNSVSSMNYTIDEYVADIIHNLQEVCKDEDVTQPNIVSESGRAVVAHHSCIIMPIFGNIHLGDHDDDIFHESEDSDIVRQMKEIVGQVTAKNMQEAFHDAAAKKEEALSLFKLGFLSLEDRAKVEALYWKLLRQIVVMNAGKKRIPKDLVNLESLLSDQYLANFSLFQTAPDHWAFDQLFPIVPLHRLDEAPNLEATIADITCDSDGKIDQFVDPGTPKPNLALHSLKDNEPYYIGMFLLGAYQDIMGDMHNLFGRVHEVHVFCDDEDPEDFYLEEVIPGDTVADVLERLQYYPKEMMKDVKKEVDEKVRAGAIKPKDGVALVDFYEAMMNSYTYLSKSKVSLPTAENLVPNGQNSGSKQAG
ncbi:biosynthetic arginine decarboxylase [bacterium]|nr:biosynthetic arginine decarboxylase [bacterium]